MSLNHSTKSLLACREVLIHRSRTLAREQGYQVEGLFMKNWEEDDGTEYCTQRKISLMRRRLRIAWA